MGGDGGNGADYILVENISFGGKNIISKREVCRNVRKLTREIYLDVLYPHRVPMVQIPPTYYASITMEAVHVGMGW